MAMTPEEIEADLARAFSHYAARQRRAGLVLGNRLAVLKNEAGLARIHGAEFDAMARRQMEAADARMRANVQTDHPVVAVKQEAT
ncbi:hypothetical protein [Phaeobacter sp. B1627]|uniref:hypothetical protein n=1 Tax=Phaeobacter sp. B1627 TaxID=2583809 RepID=UPI0011194C11|nr:hypothetical protein [Phaeobacter sp. B1627]TNJ40476.1 hypothetical protein FGE21_17825 [Phaeobacter sp. B1627]